MTAYELLLCFGSWGAKSEPQRTSGGWLGRGELLIKGNPGSGWQLLTSSYLAPACSEPEMLAHWVSQAQQLQINRQFITAWCLSSWQQPFKHKYNWKGPCGRNLVKAERRELSSLYLSRVWCLNSEHFWPFCLNTWPGLGRLVEKNNLSCPCLMPLPPTHTDIQRDQRS